jgi:predicted phosphodiesterase
MRVAVISDMHGNCIALDAVVADLLQDTTDQLVCLGDAIQGGPQPAQTVARLRELGCPVVMGNADAWLLTGVATSTAETVSDQQRETRDWSLAQLSAADRAFIAAFQPTVEIPLDGTRNLLCFHGSPHSFDDILLPDSPVEEFDRLLGPFVPRIQTGGHTHVQYVRRLGASDAFFFNPGSVGFAYSHHQPDDAFRADPWAEYAVLSATEGRLALEFRRVPLDPTALIAAIHESGMPYADRVATRYQPLSR